MATVIGVRFKELEIGDCFMLKCRIDDLLARRDIMKIRKLLSDKKRLFSQLKVGEIFLYGEDDVAFIKVEGHKVNAVNLQNGEFYVFRANNRVIPVDEVTLTTSSGFGIC